MAGTRTAGAMDDVGSEASAPGAPTVCGHEALGCAEVVNWSAIGRATAEKRAGEDEGGDATLFVVSEGRGRLDEVRWHVTRSSSRLQWQPVETEVIPAGRWPEQVRKVAGRRRRWGRLSPIELESDIPHTYVLGENLHEETWQSWMIRTSSF